MPTHGVTTVRLLELRRTRPELTDNLLPQLLGVSRQRVHQILDELDLPRHPRPHLERPLRLAQKREDYRRRMAKRGRVVRPTGPRLKER